MDGVYEAENTDAPDGSCPSSQFTRRRSSAPKELIAFSSPIIHQDSHFSSVLESGNWTHVVQKDQEQRPAGSRPTASTKSVRARKSNGIELGGASGEEEQESKIVAPANSPAIETRE